MFDAFDSGAAGEFALDAGVAAAESATGVRGGLVCAACRNHVTRHEFVMVVAGNTVHTYTNPHGFTFTFRTFTLAPGCRAHGAPTVEFSWFPPCAWQMAACGGCGGHLGWRFAQPASGYFFALIENRLCEDRVQ